MIAFGMLCMGLLTYWIRVSRKHSFKLLFPVFSIPILCLATVLQILGFLSGLGWIFPYSQTVFVFGLLSVLVFGANIFLALLYSIWEKI